MARHEQEIGGRALRSGLGTGRGPAYFGLLAAFALCALSLPARAREPHPRHKQDSKHQVEKLEETWRLAQLNGDAEAMDRLLSDDYVGITMSGQVVTKMQQLDRMRSRTIELTRIELGDVKVKLIGSTAIVTSLAKVEGTADGQPMHGNYRYTRVYTRLPSGAWKITNFEATRVGEPGANGRRPPHGDTPGVSGHSSETGTPGPPHP